MTLATIEWIGAMVATTLGEAAAGVAASISAAAEWIRIKAMRLRVRIMYVIT
jgi:hypothetical protein